jgi:hypothetical protein
MVPPYIAPTRVNEKLNFHAAQGASIHGSAARSVAERRPKVPQGVLALSLKDGQAFEADFPALSP